LFNCCSLFIVQTFLIGKTQIKHNLFLYYSHKLRKGLQKALQQVKKRKNKKVMQHIKKLIKISKWIRMKIKKESKIG